MIKIFFKKIKGYSFKFGFQDGFHNGVVIPHLYYTGRNFTNYGRLKEESKHKFFISCCPELCPFEWSNLLKPCIEIYFNNKFIKEIIIWKRK